MRCMHVPYGTGHNIRLLLSLLRLFAAYLLASMLTWLDRSIGARRNLASLVAA